MKDVSKIEKPYYNQAIEAELIQIIPYKKYKEFSMLLRDIFHRRAYEFGLSDQEILAEARNFVKNVDTIEFAPKEEMGRESYMGVYFSSNKAIKLNQDYYMKQEDNRNTSVFSLSMYSTLVHEVYHAINDYSSDRGFMGLSYFDPSKEMWVGCALNEVFTETAANRASYGKKIEDADKFRSETDGYGDITFSTNLLAAALGVTEKDILKAGIQHRGKLEEIVKSQFLMNPKFGNRAWDYYVGNFEQALDTIYNVGYKEEESTPKEQDMKKSLIISGLTALFDTTYRLANFQIGQELQDVSHELADSVDHRFRKIEKIMTDTMKAYSARYNFSKEEINAVYNAVNEARMGLGNRVVAINLISRERGKITDPKERANQESYAKRGYTFLKENLEVLENVYGIQRPEEIGYTGALGVTADLSYENYILKEDYDQGFVWDNEPVEAIIYRIYCNEMKEKGLRTDEYYTMQTMPTEEIPTVKPEGKCGSDNKEAKGGFFYKMVNRIRDSIIAFKNRRILPLPEGHNGKQDDRSDYYAQIAAMRAAGRQTFDARYAVKPEDLAPLKLGDKPKDKTLSRKDEGRY